MQTCWQLTGRRNVGLAYYPHMPIHANRHVVDISFTVCLFFFVCVCVSRIFGKGYLGRGLTQSDEILQDGRPRSPPGHLPFWWPLAQGLPRPRSKGQQSNFWLEISRKRWQIRRRTPEAHISRTHGLSIGIIKFDLGWPWGVKNQRQWLKNFGSAYLEHRLRDRAEIL